jgi:diguanylate cyclase (GGDEF)-like protein
MSSSLSNNGLRRLADAIHTRAREDEALLAYLVGTIHSARAPLFASMAMAMLITLGAYAMTGAPIFLWHLFAHMLIGAGRIHRLSLYERRNPAEMSAREVLEFDVAFGAWSALYAATLGLTCYQLTALSRDADTFALGLALCTGFTLAFVTRSAGRPRILLLQVVGITAPQIYALVTLPAPHGAVYAALVGGLVVAALVMGRHGYQRMVDLFEADEANRRMARQDMLTGLLNRFAANQAFAEALTEAESRPGEALAVITVDLDRFKEINDTLGHAVGDAVIVETGRRLSALAGPDWRVARMGGDEFMIVARGRGFRGEDIKAIGERIVASLSRPFEIERLAVSCSASVGVAVYPEHGREMAELMKHADFALYEAKRGGRGRCRLFDASMRRRLAEDRLLETELEQAIREDQFEVWYQPIQNIETGSVRGYEALVRWRHPTRGLVPPAVFVPIAEQNGSILALGQIVLQKACEAASRWDRRISIAVNLSPSQFRRPEMLVEGVKYALARAGLEPERLYLEITESLLMEDTPQTRAAINELAELGVKFSLDDFGVGYSSLAYIQSYPFSKIKIDRKFVENIDSDRVSGAIVASVCALAERIDMQVIAEGVETPVQSRALRELGVEFAQGYLYGRPSRIVNAPPKLQLVASR